LVPGKNSPLNNQKFVAAIEQTIAGIFNSAGLGADFVNGNSPADFNLVVANSVPSDSPVASNVNAGGYTPVDDSGAVTDRGTVYESRLEQFDFAESQNFDFLGIGMGRAGAHEAGHYFLQLNGHSASGLMRASFPNGPGWHSPDLSNQFSFTPDQVAKLKKDCEKRHPSSGGGGGEPINNNFPFIGDLCYGDPLDGGWSGGCDPHVFYPVPY
jgi:hypothetical protein